MLTLLIAQVLLSTEKNRDHCCLMETSIMHLFFSSRRRHTRLQGDWSSDVCFFRSDRRHAACRRDRDVALPVIVVEGAAPGDHAAVLLQGETVDDAGGDRRYTAGRRRWDDARTGPRAAAAAPGDNGAARRRLRRAWRDEQPDAQ